LIYLDTSLALAYLFATTDRLSAAAAGLGILRADL
jgi:hypothetical protein